MTETGIEVQSKEVTENKYFTNVDRYTSIAYASKSQSRLGAEPLYRITNEMVLSHLNFNKEYKVLDVGCGVGRNIYDLSKIYKKSNFTGFDYSLPALVKAKELYKVGLLIPI